MFKRLFARYKGLVSLTLIIIFDNYNNNFSYLSRLWPKCFLVKGVTGFPDAFNIQHKLFVEWGKQCGKSVTLSSHNLIIQESSKKIQPQHATLIYI